MTGECWFCRDERGAEDPPGGWIYENERWRIWHALPDWAPRGTTIVESRRHYLDFAEMTPQEAGEYAPLMGRMYAAIKTAVGAERVYAWSTMAQWPHLHMWLIPWWADSATWGPAYLADAMSQGTDPRTATETATALRTAMAHVS